MFPFQNIRPGQKELMSDVSKAVQGRKHLIASAPTGIGKTAAVLAATLEYAINNDKIVFFVTPKHSQHRIAIETVQKINQAGYNLKAVDIIGKKWLCSVPSIEGLGTGDFYEYCKTQVKNDNCPFYKKTKQNNKLTKTAHATISGLIKNSIFHAENVKQTCAELCPYEITLGLARKCNVIVCDYYHIFSPIGTQLLSKLDKTFEDVIIIVDEAHNLPSRIRSLLSSKITTKGINYAKKEDKDFDLDVKKQLEAVESVIKMMFRGKEETVNRDQFISIIDEFQPYDNLVSDLEEVAEAVREEKKKSFIGNIANFLKAWTNTSEGFVRYIEQAEGRKKQYIALNNNCMDPSVVSQSIADASHSLILMSGTLDPTHMYRNILGMDKERTICNSYRSGFAKENRLNLVDITLTTKYSERTKEMYHKIADHISEYMEMIPGNVAVFFPSYHLRDSIARLVKTSKIPLLESRLMDKQEKTEFYRKFIAASKTKTGGVLFGVQGASFAEGVDYPGDVLNGVIIVGLALDRPTLEIQALINYYDKKFGKGYDYAYNFPAIKKALQASGRCIRSENDRGICIFLDKRFMWTKYRNMMNLDLKINPENSVIRNFFQQQALNAF